MVTIGGNEGLIARQRDRSGSRWSTGLKAWLVEKNDLGRWGHIPRTRGQPVVARFDDKREEHRIDILDKLVPLACTLFCIEKCREQLLTNVTCPVCKNLAQLIWHN